MPITNDKGLTLFAVMTHAGMCGTDAIMAIWAKDENDAISQCESWGWDNYWNFNDEGDTEDEDTVSPELDIWAEPWDDEVHPGKWPGGSRYSDSFKDLDSSF